MKCTYIGWYLFDACWWARLICICIKREKGPKYRKMGNEKNKKTKFRMSNRCLPSSLCCLLLSFLLWTKNEEKMHQSHQSLHLMMALRWWFLITNDILFFVLMLCWESERDHFSNISGTRRETTKVWLNLHSTRPTNIQASKLWFKHDIMSVAVVVSKTSRVEQTKIIKLHIQILFLILYVLLSSYNHWAWFYVHMEFIHNVSERLV